MQEACEYLTHSFCNPIQAPCLWNQGPHRKNSKSFIFILYLKPNTNQLQQQRRQQFFYFFHFFFPFDKGIRGPSDQPSSYTCWKVSQHLYCTGDHLGVSKPRSHAGGVAPLADTCEQSTVLSHLQSLSWRWFWLSWSAPKLGFSSCLNPNPLSIPCEKINH